MARGLCPRQRRTGERICLWGRERKRWMTVGGWLPPNPTYISKDVLVTAPPRDAY
jgi:hypothetical protein